MADLQDLTIIYEFQGRTKNGYKNKAVSRATDDFSHINTFNQIKKYEKNYNLNKLLSLIY